MYITVRIAKAYGIDNLKEEYIFTKILQTIERHKDLSLPNVSVNVVDDNVELFFL